MQEERELESSFQRFRDHSDMRALARVFDASAPELLAIAQHLARRREDAEDLVQATFLTAIEKAPSFDRSRALTPWLLGILSLHAHVLRARQGRELDVERLHAGESEAPEREASARELAAAVASAVASMPDAYATVVRRHLIDGARPNELASELGISPVNARVRLHRGLKLLRAAIPSGFAGVGLGWLASWRALRAVRRAVLAQASAKTGAAIPSSLATTLVVAALALAAVAAPAWWPLVRGAKDRSTASEVATVAAADSDSSSSAPAELAVATPRSSTQDTRVEAPMTKPAAANARSATERTIRGRLLLPSGAPATGASVELNVPDILNSSWTPPPAVRAAADATFAVVCEPPPRLMLALEARLERYATIAWRWNDLSARGDVELGDATFERAGTLKATLADAHGAPLSSGWLIDVFDASESRRGNQDMIQGQARVGAGGVATLDDLAPRRYRVHATRGIIGEVAWTQVDVAADRVSELALVYDGPDPERRIGVSTRVLAPANALDVDAQHIVLIGRDGRTRTATELPHTVGRFVFENVEPGVYDLAIDDPHFTRLERSGVAPGDSLRLELAGAAAIALRVRGADGREIESYTLSAQFVQPNQWYSSSTLRSPGAPAPERGVYASFLPGDTRLDVAIDGAPAKRVLVSDLVAGETRAVDVVFGGGLALTGRVVGQDGARPAAGVTVQLLRGRASAPTAPAGGGATFITVGSSATSSADAAMSTATDAAGNFRFEAVDAGEWTVRASWNALLTADRTVRLASQTAEPIELVQPPSGWFEGLVESRASDTRWVVTAHPSEFDPFMRSVAADADAEGKFRLGPLPAGRFGVDASQKREPGSGWGNGSHTLTTFESMDDEHASYAIEAGQVTELRLGSAELPTAGAKVRVVVDGGSADGGTVYASSANTTPNRSGAAASADIRDGGIATLQRLPPGVYRLSVAAANDTWVWCSDRTIELRANEVAETALAVTLARRTVRFVDTDGKPLAFRAIAWSTDDGGHHVPGTTHEQGDIALALPEGRVRFTCPGRTLKPDAVDWRAGPDAIVLVATKGE